MLNQFLMNIVMCIGAIFLFSLAVLAIRVLVIAIPYWKSTYYNSTHKSFKLILFDKGAYGEYLIYKYLRKFEKNGAKFLFNCYILKDDGETSEIDVIMIYKSGIYVFESKNYGGWIFGSESNKMWTQTLPNGRFSRKERFYNPIMQNRTHIKWLEKYLTPTDPIHCIVAFSERCVFKKLDITSGDVVVIKRYNVSRIVDEIDQRVGARLNDVRIKEIYDMLYPYSQVPEDVKEMHIENIRNSNKVISINRCPKCGGELILRKAKRGPNTGNQFYGCSNYPKCRYIKNL